MSDATDALAKVEQSLDGLRYGLGARALGIWRSRARYRSLGGRPSPSAPTFARANSLLEAGALESAAGLVEHVCAEMTLGAWFCKHSSIAAIDLSLMTGDRQRAEQLARQFRFDLSQTAQGAGRLECLGIASALACPDGRWNLLGASRRIADGTVRLGDLAAQVGFSSRAYLAEPELGFVFASALWAQEPARAARFLTRCLSALGVRDELVDRGEQRGEVLAGLSARAPGGAPRGPLVSVLLAAHDAEHTLGYALDSLLAQSYGSLEILVADDASRDGTLDVMKRYASEPRIRLFRSEANQGAYNVRNLLAEQALGELVTFHDADDWAFPSRIAAQVAALQSSGARGVVTGLVRMRSSGEIVFFKNQRAVRLSPVSLLLARSTFRELGGFRSARVGADHELATRLMVTFGARSLLRLRAPWMLSRSAPGSATSTSGTESSEDGYRSPIRRRYSQLVFDRYVERAAITEADMDEALRASGNWADRSALLPL